MGIRNNRDTTRSQGFTYDQLNRIVAAQTPYTSGSNCWGETYTIDEWANMTAIGAITGYSGCTQEGLNVSANSNNQLVATGYSYDASGNMLTDGANTYTYNAESEISTAAGLTYLYDGDGKRVVKGTGTVYWYGGGSQVLSQSLPATIAMDYIYFGGKRVAERRYDEPNVYYYEADMLGSSRTTVVAGQTSPFYDADFYPFGGERAITDTGVIKFKFEGKERDTETGDDDFGARYYNSRIGRWLSADWSSVPAPVPYANLTNPQTLNLYAMVSDNPETFADLDGHTIGPPPSPGGPNPGSSNYGGYQTCSLDGMSMNCSFMNLLTGNSGATESTSVEDTADEESLQNQTARQQEAQGWQDAIIAQIMNFDTDVDAAVSADLARGSSSDPQIDSMLHNTALAEHGQLEAQVGLREQDIHKADIQKSIDAYVSSTSSPAELSHFLGRLSRVQYLYDKENAGWTRAGKAATWAASRNPISSIASTVIRALTPTPTKQVLLSHGVAAVNKRLDDLGTEP